MCAAIECVENSFTIIAHGFAVMHAEMYWLCLLENYLLIFALYIVAL